MATLRQVHRIMNERRFVLLGDGRVGKITRLDTFFPKNETVVTVWLTDGSDAAIGSSRGGVMPPSMASPSDNSLSGLVKVGLDDVVGAAS
ncbi:MAG TPA: hypothetical protein VF103_04975 [Polyangiaceae bacterium]